MSIHITHSNTQAKSNSYFNIHLSQKLIRQLDFTLKISQE